MKGILDYSILKRRSDERSFSLPIRDVITDLRTTLIDLAKIAYYANRFRVYEAVNLNT